MTRDEVRERIQRILDTAITTDNECNVIQKADQILAIPDIAEGLKLLELQRQGKVAKVDRDMETGLWVKEVKDG